MKLEMFISVAIPLLMGGLAAYIAKNRGRNPAIWFFVGIFFGLLGVIILLLLPVSKISRSTSFGINQGDPNTIEVKAQELPVVSVTLLTDIDHKQWHWLDAAHKQYGPISFIDLQRCWQEGLITSRSFVWTDGMSDWKRIEELAELDKKIRT